MTKRMKQLVPTLGAQSAATHSTLLLLGLLQATGPWGSVDHRRRPCSAAQSDQRLWFWYELVTSEPHLDKVGLYLQNSARLRKTSSRSRQ